MVRYNRNMRPMGGSGATKAAIRSSALLIVWGLVWSGAIDAGANRKEDDPFCRDHVRLVKKHFAVRFRTDAAKYGAGGTAVFRLDNIGRVAAWLIGEEFAVDRYENGRWVLDPATPNGFPRIRLGVLKPGESGFCRSFSIPAEMAPGHYRFRKNVGAGSAHKRKRLTAEFRITD
jgi:Bacterial Ig-like domain